MLRLLLVLGGRRGGREGELRLGLLRRRRRAVGGLVLRRNDAGLVELGGDDPVERKRCEVGSGQGMDSTRRTKEDHSRNIRTTRPHPFLAIVLVTSQKREQVVIELM